jgi:hypothetical protein
MDVDTSVLLNRTAREFLRAENIRMFRQEGHVPDAAIAVRDAWREPETAEQLKFLGASIAFIFFHEFGHHAHAAAGSFDLSLERIGLFLKDRLMTSRVREEEAAADAYAVQLFKPYLQKQAADGVPPVMLFDAAQTLARNFKAVHYFKMFDGLRGFSYRDLFLSLYHGECEEFRDGTGNQRQQSVLNDLNYLFYAEERDMVLLSEEEYAVVRSKLLENLVSTHPYPASRGAAMYDAVLSLKEFAEFGQSKNIFANELATIEAIRNDVRADAGPHFGSPGSLHWSLADALKGVSPDNYRIKKAVNCAAGECSIVEFARTGEEPFGYLEFAAVDGTVRLFKLYVRAPILDFMREGANYSQSEIARRLEERLAVVSLLANTLNVGPVEAMTQMSQVVMQSKICGAAGTISDRGDRKVGITALAREDWLRMDILGIGTE